MTTTSRGPGPDAHGYAGDAAIDAARDRGDAGGPDDFDRDLASARRREAIAEMALADARAARIEAEARAARRAQDRAAREQRVRAAADLLKSATGRSDPFRVA